MSDSEAGDTERRTNYDQHELVDIRESGRVRVFEYVRRSDTDGQCPFCRRSETVEFVDEVGYGGGYRTQRYVCECGASGESIWTWEAGTEPLADDERPFITDGGTSTNDTDWEFRQGETLIEQQETPQMPGIEEVEKDDPREYTVKWRLYDADDGNRLYYLEWEVETPGGPRIENQLYDAGLVRTHYRSVHTDTDR